MKTIRVRRKLDSETLHLPELRPLLGKEVEIIVHEEGAAPTPGADEFWNPPSLEELARRQGVKHPARGPYATWTEDDFEGLEDALNDWRAEGEKDRTGGNR